MPEQERDDVAERLAGQRDVEGDVADDDQQDQRDDRGDHVDDELRGQQPGGWAGVVDSRRRTPFSR